MATIGALQQLEQHQVEDIRQRVRILTLVWSKTWELVTNSADKENESDQRSKEGQKEPTKLRQAAMHIAEALVQHKNDDIAVGLLLRADEVTLVLRNGWPGYSR